jgi:uncharacterized protein (DUF3820 family)
MKQRSITIKVDLTIYKDATATLKARGTDVETWFRLQLCAFAKSGKAILSLTDKMPFGKYQGALVEDVVRADTKYATWMVAQDYSTKFNSDVLGLIQELIEV